MSNIEIRIENAADTFEALLEYTSLAELKSICISWGLSIKGRSKKVYLDALVARFKENKRNQIVAEEKVEQEAPVAATTDDETDTVDNNAYVTVEPCVDGGYRIRSIDANATNPLIHPYTLDEAQAQTGKRNLVCMGFIPCTPRYFQRVVESRIPVMV